MNLLIGKRQIVLATLVVTLSLAVFVNWYYTNGETVIDPQPESGTQASAENPGEALFVSAEGNEPAAQAVDGQAETQAPQDDETTPQADVTTPQADVTTPQADVTTPQADVTTPQDDETTPQADVTTPQDDVTTPQADVTTTQAGGASPEAVIPQYGDNGEYFASARLSRTNAYDESVETLQMVIESNDGNSEAAVKAADEISEITAVLQLETSLETLITAKTGSECIAVISDNSVSIVVENEKITDEMILGIHSILSDNSLTMENITISGC